MAGTLELNLGRLLVADIDVNQPIELNGDYSIQTPRDNNEENVIWFSRHGDMDGVWFRLIGEQILSFEAPMFVYAQKPCAIPIMEVL